MRGRRLRGEVLMFLACFCAPARCTATATRVKPHHFDATIAANPSRRSSSDRIEDIESNESESRGSSSADIENSERSENIHGIEGIESSENKQG
jgi:hypothetical protein